MPNLLSTHSTQAHQSLSWHKLLWRRVCHLWLLKMMGTTVGIGGFFVLYFWLMDITAARAVTVPPTAVDEWIGVNQWAVIPYGSLWLYVSLAPAFTPNKLALRAYAAGAIGIVTLAFAAYVLFPTVTSAAGIQWEMQPMLRFLKNTDAGGNAFPSLHVAFAFYTAIVIGSQIRSLQAPRWARILNWAWCAAIVYSTLATRQHVFLDVLGGLVTTCLALKLVWSRTGYAIWCQRCESNPCTVAVRAGPASALVEEQRRPALRDNVYLP